MYQLNLKMGIVNEVGVSFSGRITFVLLCSPHFCGTSALMASQTAAGIIGNNVGLSEKPEISGFRRNRPFWWKKVLVNKILFSLSSEETFIQSV